MGSDDDLADELRDLLHAAGVKPSVPEDTPESSSRAEWQLERILRQSRSPQRRRAVAAGVGLAAAGIVVALVIATGTVPPPTPPAAAATPPLLTFSVADRHGPDASHGRPARTQLLKLAEAAEHLPAQGPGPVGHVELDAWWSTNELGDAAQVTSNLIPQHLEQWRTPDGRVRQVTKLGPALTSKGRLDDNIAWDEVPVQSDDTFPGAKPPWGERIPTDSGELRHVLTGDDEPECASSSGGCLMRDAIDMQYNYVVPPRSLAALWIAMADEPTITYLGTTTDRLGRAAVGFTAPSPDGVSRLIVLADPATGAWLGDETVLVEPSPAFGFSPPAVTAFTALVTADRIEQTSATDRR